MAKFIAKKEQTSGIALGGIGTGSVELFPDGEFHQWQIANPPRWASRSDARVVDDGEGSTGALSFWVRTQTEGEVPIVRKLGMKTDAEDFTYRMFAWNKPVEEIEFEGRFPVCDLSYRDRALPIGLSLRATAPFVPHHTRESATPGFYMDFTLENPTEKPVKVSLLSALEPNFCNAMGSVNSVFTHGDATGVFLNSPNLNHWEEGYKDPNRGSLCLAAQGGEVSYITGEHFRYLREFVGRSPFGVTQESFLFDFREKGRLPSSDIGTRPAELPKKPEELTDQALEHYTEIMTAYPFAVSILERVRRIRPDFPASRQDRVDFIAACGEHMERMGKEFGSLALCSSLELLPGETKQVRFVLSWYFPNHFGEYHNRLGHYYENFFRNAREVNEYLMDHGEIAEKAGAFAEMLYKTSLPEVYPDAWSSHLSTIVKDSWYLKNGKFGLWEGLGYCGFHTTDITYHASFGLLALFPDLQLGQMEMGAAFQREDGRVHHFFTPDLDHVDGGFDRVDMNNQFVLMVCRDYLQTGDRGYLERMWPHVEAAMDSIQALDSDGDGLPDRDTTRNTYDAWNFSGAPTYICVLWLGALKAGGRLAGELGKTRRKEEWEALLEKGLVSLESRLWNGEYYHLWREGELVDDSLMTDQIDGEWFLRMAGIGGILPDERVKTLLCRIYEGNFDPEDGLVNATCPDGKQTSLMTYKNCQAEAVWTGIGYAVAALAMTVGLGTMADSLVSTIHENQMRFGKFYEHWECGYRYTRPLSSWTTLTAAAGLVIDAGKKCLRLRPMESHLVLPLCTGEVLGTVSFTDHICTITLLEGSLDGWTLDLPEGMEAIIKE